MARKSQTPQIDFSISKEAHAMSDETGRKDRPGAGSYSLEMSVEGIPTNCYLNHHPQTGRVEIVKIMPPGIPDRLVKDFADDDSAWAWLRTEYRMRRLNKLLAN
jgi:hypothetical protein